MTTSTPTPPPAARRWRKRWLIPLSIFGLLLLLFLAAFVRGTWADTEPFDPKTAGEGIICRLYQPPKDTWEIRCSMVLAHPPEKVWAVVTNYNRFADIFPTLES